MKVKLHFNRTNMRRGSSDVWTAHTYKECNQAEEILIRHNGQVIGKTVFNPDADQPRAYVELFGEVSKDTNGSTVIDV